MFINVVFILKQTVIETQRFLLAFQVLLHYQTVSEPATIRKLVSVLHKSSGEVLKKKPKLVSFFFVQQM